MMLRLKLPRKELNTNQAIVSTKILILLDTRHNKKGRTEEKNLSQKERDKIIEVLLSQERVLTLLYDKTFPPRP